MLRILLLPPPAVENIIETNTYLSGIGFENCGLALAHAFNNALSKLQEGSKTLHSEKVAFGTLLQMIIERRPQSEIDTIKDFCDSVGLPTSLMALKLFESNTACKKESFIHQLITLILEEPSIQNIPFPVTYECLNEGLNTLSSPS